MHGEIVVIIFMYYCTTILNQESILVQTMAIKLGRGIKEIALVFENNYFPPWIVLCACVRDLPLFCVLRGTSSQKSFLSRTSDFALDHVVLTLFLHALL